MSLEKSFLRICLAFSVYLSLIVGLAIFGYFTTWPVTFLTAFFVAFIIFLLFRGIIKISWPKLNKTKLVCFSIIVLFSLFIGYFHHDLPNGRDELSFIYAADRLSVSGSLEWEDYFTRPIHGVRNLEGDIFTSQFLPTYTSYLAVYNLLGNLDVLLWANVLLLLLTLGVIYYLVKCLVSEKASLIALILLLSSYVFFWFPKRTNVENISIFIIWLGIWLAARALKKNQPKYLLLGLIPFSLLAITRPEGLIFFVFYVLITLYLVAFKYRRQLLNSLMTKIFAVFVTLINLMLFFAYVSFYEARYIFNQLIDVFEGFDYFYEKTALVIASVVLIMALAIVLIKIRQRINFQRLLFWGIVAILAVYEAAFFYLVQRGDLTWVVYRSQYVFENFTFYLYFIFVVIILVGLKKRIFTDLEKIMTLILLPAFFFIVEPNIALDQPWFMRRFYPNLIPLFIILSAIVIARLELSQKKLKYLLAAFVIVGIVTTRSIFFFVEHDGLKTQVEEFNKIFSKDSLILMKPGWGWQKVSIIQHYFYGYNTLPNMDLYRSEEFVEDLPQVVVQYPSWETDDSDLLAIMNWENDQSERRFLELIKQYKDIYIVTDNKNSNFFTGFNDYNMELVDEFLFSYKELAKELNFTQYIQQNKIIDIKKIRADQNSLPPNDIANIKINLTVYKLINPEEYYPFEYLIEAPEVPREGISYSVLSNTDILNYKKKLRNISRSAELIND